MGLLKGLYYCFLLCVPPSLSLSLSLSLSRHQNIILRLTCEKEWSSHIEGYLRDEFGYKVCREMVGIRRLLFLDDALYNWWMQVSV